MGACIIVAIEDKRMDNPAQHALAAPEHNKHGNAMMWGAACLCFGALAITIWMMNGDALFMEMVSAAWALCF
jgi:hypothetical protein